MNKSSPNEIDGQTKFVLARLNHTERFFEDLGNSFGAYTRKSARLRDKTDELAKVLYGYSSTETVSQNLTQMVSNVSKSVLMLADFRDSEIKRIESRVMGEIAQYDLVCRATREEVKINTSIRNKEILRKKQKLKGNNTVSRAEKEFEKMVDDFEEQKSRDIQELLIDFVMIQLKMHIQSVNVLTKVYKEIQEVDDKKDLQDLKAKLFGETTSEDTDLSKLNKVRSQSMGALNTIFHANQFRRKFNKNQSLASLDSEFQGRRPTPKITLTKTTSVESVADDTEEPETESDTEAEEEIVLQKNSHLHVKSLN